MSLRERLRWAWAALQGRHYAGAKTTQSTGSWAAPAANVNQITGLSLPTLRNRARQLVRDMPHAARAAKVLQDYTVGDGLVLQARVTEPGGAKLARSVNQQIEDAWRFWADEADLGRHLHLHEMMSLAKRQEIEAGEYLLQKKVTRGAGRYLPFALLPVEPDYLSEWVSAAALPGNEIQQGVEYDPRTGRRLAYHFVEDSSLSLSYAAKSYRVPAAQVVHGFETLRPHQLRGVPAFAPAVLLAHSLRDYLEAEIDGARMAARWLAFVKSADPVGTMGAFGAKDDTPATRKVEEVGTAIKEYLLPNEDVTLASHNRPGDSFDPFTRFVLRSFAAVMGVSYELLTADYSQANYSSQKGSRVAFGDGIRVQRGRFVRQFCQPLYREFLGWAVLSGRLDLGTRFFQDPWPFYRVTWLGPGMESIDPLREGKADIELVRARLKSPQEILLERGRDPEAMLDELAQWQELLAERGLEDETEEISTAAANNPAAVDPDTAEEDDGEEDDAPADRRFRRVK